jgi:hypothetical protein
MDVMLAEMPRQAALVLALYVGPVRAGLLIAAAGG